MKSSISIDSLGVGVPVEHPRRKGPARTEVIHLQVHCDAFWVWDEECQLCSEIYNFEPGDERLLGHNLEKFPHIDAAFKALTEHYVTQRTNLVGAHLEPALHALERVIAERDGSSVYFAGSGGQIKIGWSRKVSARLAQLQTGSPIPIKLLGTMPGGRAVERRLHEQFAHLRLAGEWFADDPELLAYIGEATAR
jgi:hypothetical protein